MECQGMPDVVLWNPWADKAKALADMGDEEFRHMVCVEPAVAGSGAVEVAPGGSVLVGQRLTVSDL